MVSALWLAVYALIAVAVPVSDAGAQHDAPIVAHWEDLTDESCPPVHDASLCQLCKVLRSAGTVATTSVDLPALTVGSVKMPPAPTGPDVRPKILASATPRGPPSV